jgi:hypothetical protein
MAVQKTIVGKSMPCDMLRRNCIPSAVLDRNPGLAADWLKADFHMG